MPILVRRKESRFGGLGPQTLLACVTGLLGGLVLGPTGVARPDPCQQGQEGVVRQRRVDAKELEVTDQALGYRAILGPCSEGFYLRMKLKDSANEIWIGISKDGEASYMLRDPKHGAVDMFAQAGDGTTSLSLGGSGAQTAITLRGREVGSLVVRDHNGRERCWMGVDRDRSAGIKLMTNDGVAEMVSDADHDVVLSLRATEDERRISFGMSSSGSVATIHDALGRQRFIAAKNGILFSVGDDSPLFSAGVGEDGEHETLIPNSDHSDR